MGIRTVLMAAALLLAGCSNPCERLCDAYFQLELRCDLLACEDAAVAPPVTCSASPAQGTCPLNSNGAVDENSAIQETEYAIQQCQADYSRLNPGDQNEDPEGAACQSALPDFEALLLEYDNATDTCTKLQLCERFADLKGEMGI